MSRILLLIWAILLWGCAPPGFSEVVEEDRTATIDVCGYWAPELLEQFDDAIADWNSQVQLCSGAKPLKLGIERPDKLLQEEDLGDEQHCGYIVSEDSPTADGRRWYEENEKAKDRKAAQFVNNDDILLYLKNADGTCHVDGTPEGWGCRVIVKPTLGHEAGHGLGYDHAPDDVESIMLKRHHASSVTSYDVSKWPDVHPCS